MYSHPEMKEEWSMTFDLEEIEFHDMEVEVILLSGDKKQGRMIVMKDYICICDSEENHNIPYHAIACVSYLRNGEKKDPKNP